LQPVLALSPTILAVLIAVGAVTAVGCSLLAIAQIDIKRTLSYLVSAYMGVIFMAVGTQQTEAAYAFMLVHGLANALLLMSVGSVIWNSVTQDVRQYGGLWSRRPISGMSFLVAGLSLVALPPLGGFWVMLKFMEGIWAAQPVAVAMLLVVNLFTSFSLIRTFSLLWGGKAKSFTARSPEVFWPMILPMTLAMGFTLHIPQILAALGWLPSLSAIHYDHALILTGTTVLAGTVAGYIYLAPTVTKPIQVPAFVQNLVSLFTWVPSEAPGRKDPVVFSSPISLTPRLYRVEVVFVIGVVSEVTSWIDRNLIDGLGNLLASLTLFSGKTLRYATGGQSQFYLLTILVGTAVIGTVLCWPVLSNLTLVFGTQTSLLP
jgi:NAD(P)H-quinone oxidoreductase subunit 5